MRIKNLWLPVFLLILAACTKKETELLSLKTDYNGKVYTRSEFGDITYDYANVKVTVEGIEPQIVLTTDTAGAFNIKGLPLGLYNIRFNLEGYGEMSQNLRCIGSDEPRTLNYYIYKKSSTTITDYTLETNNNTLIIRGTLQHQIPKEKMSYWNNWPYLGLYLGNKPEVNDRNCLDSRIFKALQSDPNRFEHFYTINTSDFPSGSKIYVVLRGKNLFYTNSIFDFETERYYDTCLGTPSQVKSIVVP